METFFNGGLDLTSIILSVVIAFALFMLLREFCCWYFKINRKIMYQQKIWQSLLKIIEQNGGDVNWEDFNNTTNKYK